MSYHDYFKNQMSFFTSLKRAVAPVLLSLCAAMLSVSCSSSTSPSTNNPTGVYPKMIGSPTFSVSSASVGQTITVTVPVTSDAKNVTVFLGLGFQNSTGLPKGSASALLYGGGSTVNMLGDPSVTVSFKVGPAVGSAMESGKYYAAVQLNPKADGSDQTYFTTYLFSPTLSATNYEENDGPSGTNGTATSFSVPFIQVQ